MSSSFHCLEVSATQPEIDGNAISVCFRVPAELRNDFKWLPGQHLILRFVLDNEEVIRTYTISSSPFSGEPLRITVKRVRDGLVSKHINEQVKEGDWIELMLPFGGFHLKADPSARRTHYFYGGGSGITPLYSMIESVMLAEPNSDVHLLYANQRLNSIIFYRDLEQLIARYPDRLSISHVFSSPSMWDSLQPWHKGRVDRRLIEKHFEEFPAYAQDAQYYICGPGDMNTSVKQALRSLDVPCSRIHSETFGGETKEDLSIDGVAARLSVLLERQRHCLDMKPNQTILESILGQGIDAPFSCLSGICGACKAQLHDGTVHMRTSAALEDDDIASGIVLACQSVATSTALKLKF